MSNKLIAGVAFATALFAGAGAAVPLGGAQAATIAGLYNTGVDNSGTAVVGDVTDLHWLLNGGAAYTSVTNGSFPQGPWIADDSVSRWITPTRNAADSLDPSSSGFYTYTLSFVLTPQQAAAGASFTGQFAADNTGDLITLNGNTLGSNIGGFDHWTTFGATAGDFIAGTNTLAFVVENFAQSTGNPTGLRVEFLSSTIDQTPLPAALPLFVSGLGALGLFGWRRKRKAAAITA